MHSAKQEDKHSAKQAGRQGAKHEGEHSAKQAAERDPAPAVTRSIRILGLLEASSKPLTLSDIARELDLAKSSTANLCAALVAGRMIERTGYGYRLGRRTAELGGAYALGFNQVREFFDVCANSPVLADQVVQISMLDGHNVLYLARHEGRAPYSVGTPLGSRLPAALSASGVAILATLSEATVSEILEQSPVQAVGDSRPRPIAERLETIAAARERGYAIDPSESFAAVVGVAVALEPFSPSDPLLAMGVAIPQREATEEKIRQVGAALVEAAAELTNPLAVAGPRR